MDIKEIAKAMTREEFIEKEVNGSVCPRFYGLKDFSGSSKCHGYSPEHCHQCYEFATKDVKFKGEDEVKYFTWGVFKAITENPKLKFKRLSDGLIFSGDNEHFIWEPGREHLSPKDEWVLVQEPKQVSIEEAMKAFGENKKVVFEVRGEKFNYTGLNIQGGHYLNEYSITPLRKPIQLDIKEGIGPTIEHYFHEALIYGTWFVEG